MAKVSELNHLGKFGVLVFALAAVAVLTAPSAAAVSPNRYAVTPLVSNTAMGGATVDGHLVNAWGLVAGPTTPWWVSDNGVDLSTLYTAAGGKIPLEVGVAGAPTGLVFNGDDRHRTAALRDRLRERPRGRHQPHVGRSGDGRIRRPEPPRWVRAVRDPGDRHSDLRDVREAGWGSGRSRRAEPGPRGRLRRRREFPRPRRAARPAERALGHRDGAGELRHVRWRLAYRELRGRPHQRLPGTARRDVRPRRRPPNDRWTSGHNRRTVGLAVRTRGRRQRPDGHAVLHRGPERRGGRTLRFDPSRIVGPPDPGRDALADSPTESAPGPGTHS